MSILTLNSENYKEEVLQAEEPVIVDFYANWCGPCKMMGPVIEEIANEANNYKVGKVDVDENQELAMKYGIMSIPTIVIIEKGEVKAQLVGVRSKEEILAAL